MQIQTELRFFQENLAVFSFCTSLFALVSSWGIFWNSRRAFLVSNYPKIRVDLCTPKHYLPVYDIYNESDNITANDIQIEISIRSWFEFNVFRGRWFSYTHVKLARLKPLESFVPSDLSSDELSAWLKDRGYEPAPPLSAERQKILSNISKDKSYDIRLTVTYTSNKFGANRICKISKKYRLVSCSNPEAVDPRDKFYWKLNNVQFML